MTHPAMMIKAKKLRALARDRDCQIRIPGVCNGDRSTVVLCHLAGAGMGRKHHDLLGAHGCSDCHAVVDGHKKSDYPKELLKLWHLEGVMRTVEILIEEGHVRIG
jgi:hypothetical protein